MIRLTTLAFGLFALIFTCSCGKDAPKQKRPDVTTLMTIHVKDNPSLKSSDLPQEGEESISVEECMRRTTTMRLIAGGESRPTPFAISEDLKDYATNSIKMPAITVIDDYGRISGEFGEGRDFILVQDGLGTGKVDTVGYIPNRVVHEAFAQAKKAHAEERYEDAVKIFTSAFVAHPCTARQYEALKAKGLN